MVFITVIAVIFALEHYMKKHMDEVRTEKDRRELADGRIILKKYYNTGAAGNFLSHSPKVMLCIHAAVLGGAVTELFRILPQKGAGMAKLGLSFLAGGGLSNLHDRLSKGHVIDYISFGFGPNRFRKLVFNLADFFVFAGTLLVALVLCTAKRKEG